MINEFVLIVDNFKVLINWESINITQSMDNLCGTMSAKTYRFDPENPLAANIKLGAPYIAVINGIVVSTGYIDEIPISYNENSYEIEFNGRDKTCDLVDSYIEDNHEVIGFTAYEVIDLLAEQFKINVITDKTAMVLTTTRFDKIAMSAGETVFEVIMRICNQFGIMAITLGNGNLYLTRGGATSMVIHPPLMPNMIKSATFDQSYVDRFSKYICLGTTYDNKDTEIDESICVGGKYDDPLMRRYRPFVMIEDRPTTAEICAKRASVEYCYRAGHSRAIEYTVEGWTKPFTNTIWKINELIMVSDYFFDLYRPMLICEVNFTYEEGSGFTTRLKLVHPSTYSTEGDMDQYGTSTDAAGAFPKSI